MVAVCVKIHKILTYITFFIVAVAVTLLVLFFVKKNNNGKEINPESYLKNLGYKFELIDEKQIIIPTKFNESMQEYNNLQKLQGFNLEKYIGKICKQQKYSIHRNNLNDTAVANLLIYRGNVVGGELYKKNENKARILSQFN